MRTRRVVKTMSSPTSGLKGARSKDRYEEVGSALCVRPVRLHPHKTNQAGKRCATRGHQHYRAECVLECCDRLLISARLSGHHGVQGLVGLRSRHSPKMM